MEENVRLFFTATPDELKTTCATSDDRLAFIASIVDGDEYLSKVKNERKVALIDALVSCLHLAYKNDAEIDMEVEEDNNVVYVCLCAKNFIFLTAQNLSLMCILFHAKGIEAISEEEGLVKLYFDFPIY